MKQKKLLLVTALLLTVLWVRAADGDTFTAATVEGVTITYKVINENAKTCQVGDGTSKFMISCGSHIPLSTSGTLTIPQTANGYKVIAIGEYAFHYCTKLTNVVFPEGLQNIKNAAFLECSSIQNLVFPSTLVDIGLTAFYECSNMSSISVASGNNIYDSRNNCNAVIEKATDRLVLGCKNTTIPNNVKIIGFRAFHNRTGITNITIPNGVTSIEDEAFYGCSGLTSIQIPSSVTEMGTRVFSYCSNLESFSWPEGLAIINNNTFEYSGLKNIIIPEGIQTINGNAFKNCEQLESVQIPASANDISAYAFSFCKKLSSLIVADGNSTYDSRDNCNAVIKTSSNTLIIGSCATVIPASVTTLGEDCFYGSGITSITIPSTVTTFKDGIFKYCDQLADVNLSEGMTRVSGEMFRYCTGLQEIIIPSSLTGLAYYAFQGCTNLKKVTFMGNLPTFSQIQSMPEFNGVGTAENPAELIVPGKYYKNYEKKFNDGKFYGGYFILKDLPKTPDGIVYTYIAETAEKPAHYEVSGYDASIAEGLNYELTIDEEWNHLAVTAIQDGAFDNFTSLKSIVIPSTITAIGSNAFNGCQSLTNLTFNFGAPSFGESCFNQVGTELEPATLKVPIHYIYGYEKQFENGILKGGHIVLQPIAKDGDTFEMETEEGNAITYTIISTSDKTCKVGKDYSIHALSQYVNCDKITIPETTYGNTVVEIAQSAFQNCQMKEVVIPATVTTIGSVAFCGCSNLVKYSLPENLSTIGSSAFYGTKIDKVVISANITSIGSAAFGKCSSLASIIVDEENSKYDSRNNCNAIIQTATKSLIAGCKSTTIPDEIVSISTDAMSGCTQLLTLQLPSSLISISDNAFEGCSNITTVTIPASVTYIGGSAFEGCSSLRSVIFEGNVPSFNEKYDLQFKDVGTEDSPALLIVPTEYLSAYAAKMSNGKLFYGYFTLVTPSVDITTAASGYATYYNSKADATLPAGLMAYTISGLASESHPAYKQVTGNIIPAGLAVMLYSAEGETAGESKVYTIALDYTVTPDTEANNGNWLYGSDIDCTTATDGAAKYYKLSYSKTNSEQFGWHWGAADGAAFAIEGHRAWLALPGNMSSPSLTLPNHLGIMAVDGLKTDDTGCCADYHDMQGRVVKNPVRGLYIRNGKKVVVK